MPISFWRKLIEQFYPYFLEFFLPQATSLIDAQRAPTYLNLSASKAPATPFQESLLIGMRQNGGNVMLLLLVLEQKGYDNNTFGQQVFRDFARIMEEYEFKLPTAVLALFLHHSLPKDAGKYEYNMLDTTLGFNIQGLAVREQYLEDLWQVQNPFALLIAAYRWKQEHYHFPKALADGRLMLLKKTIALRHTTDLDLKKLSTLLQATANLLALTPPWQTLFEAATKAYLDGESNLSVQEKRFVEEQCF